MQLCSRCCRWGDSSACGVVGEGALSSIDTISNEFEFLVSDNRFMVVGLCVCERDGCGAVGFLKECA